MRTGLAAAALGVALAGGLGGCGDAGEHATGGGAPSREEFCAALQDFSDAADGADPDDLAAYVGALKGAADRLSGVGLPDDVPDDVRAGYDLTLARIGGLPAAASTEDVAGLGDVSAAEQEQLDALDDYVTARCPDLSGG